MNNRMDAMKTPLPKLRFSEFKENWEKKSLGTAATFYNGRAYKQEELLEQGKYKVLRVGNFFTNNNWYYSDLELEETKYCENGDLLYAWSASFGPRIWHGEKVIYHYHIWKVVAEENINKDFLYLVLEFETEKMKAQSANGLGLLHITKGTIENWDSMFPKNPAEQKKIVDCLTSLDELITAQSQKVEALQAYKKGLMQNLFPAEGESVPRLRFPEFESAGEWENTTLDSKVTKVGSGITPNGGDRNYKKIGRPFVRSQNIGWGELILDDVAFIDDATHSTFIATEIKARDVLLNITGASIGRSAIADSRIQGGNVNQHVCIIRLKTEELSPEYLNQYLLSEYGQKQIDSFQAGGNRQGLNFAQVRSFSIPVPKKIDEQIQIADTFFSLDEKISTHREKMAILQSHKRGLMQGLFPSMEEGQK